MPWPFSESIKKRACRYLLQRYLGHFLQEKLSLEQLSLDLYQGTGSLTQVPLDKWCLNEILESADAPLEVTDGFIQSISLSVPWGSLLQDNCALELKGLEMVFRPRPRLGYIYTESMLQLSCRKFKISTHSQRVVVSPFRTVNGIVNSLKRERVYTNLEAIWHNEGKNLHAPTIFISLLLSPRTMYCDETADECSGINVHQPTAFAHKLLQLSGVSFFWDEFPASTKSSPVCSATEPKLSPSWNPKITYEPHPQLTRNLPEITPSDPVQISKLIGRMELSLTLKQNEVLPGAKLDVDGQIDSIHLFLSPRQVHLLLDMVAAIAGPESLSRIELSNKDRKNRPMQQEDEYRIQMELKRYLRKESLSAGASSEQSFYETETARTPSSREEEVFFSMAEMDMSHSLSSLPPLGDPPTMDLDLSLTSTYTNTPAGSPLSTTVLQPTWGDFLDRNKQELQPPRGSSLAANVVHQASLRRTSIPSRSVSVDESRPELLFRLTVGTFSVSVLHIDPLPPPESSLNHNPLTPMARDFFARIEKIEPVKFATEDFLSFREVFSEACSHDHLRYNFLFLSINYLNSIILKLLTFRSEEENDSHTLPCLQLHYKHSDNRGPQGSQGRLTSIPQKAELQIKLSPVFCELDISIVDRLNSLLQPQKLTTVEMMASHMYTSYNKHINLHKAFTEVFLDDSHTPANCRVSVQVTAPALNLSVRFPIPDLRSDQERGPWFKKSLQKEILHLEFTDIEFKTEFVGGSTPEQVKLELTFKELTGKCVHIVFEYSFFFNYFYQKLHKYSILYSDNNVFLSRISNDLLLWEPTAPSPVETFENLSYGVGLSVASQLINTFSKDSFSQFKSAVNYDDESGSEEETLQYYSTVDPNYRSRRRKKLDSQNKHLQSFLSVQLNVTHGLVSIFTDVKQDDGKTLEGKYGEFWLEFNNGSLFSVTKYEGFEDRHYVCLHSSSLNLYHQGMVDGAVPSSEIRLPSTIRPHWLEPTICFLEEDGLSRTSSDGVGENCPNMLTVAVKIQSDKIESNTKEFLVAVGLRGATLQHRVLPSGLSWHEQILYFLNISDEPVLGYNPPATVTTFHVHLWSCALDYREALLMSYTFSVVELESLFYTISTVRIEKLEAILKKKKIGEVMKPYYVRVMDMGLLELTITTVKSDSDGERTKPRFELRCSSDVIHIRTCSDSCAALMNLIQYIASYGDLHPPSKTEIKCGVNKPKMKVETFSQPSSHGPLLAESEQQILRDLMSDAMEEIETHQTSSAVKIEPNGVLDDRSQTQEPSCSDLFLFPDESGNVSQDPSPTYASFTHHLINETMGDVPAESDDFCILFAPKAAVSEKEEEPVIKKLVDDAILIKENHFSQPMKKTDASKAPLHFPVPLVRYVVKEISLIWHLYGGRDFGSAPPTSPAKSFVPHSSPSHTPTRHGRSTACGGRGRNPDFLMEIQLSKTGAEGESGLLEQPVSRQIFIVQDLEIRDRLATSQMNKFLYLYCSKEMPRKAHSNMLTVKALHVRPESGRSPQECCLRVSLMPLRLNIDQVVKKSPGAEVTCSLPRYASSLKDPSPVISFSSHKQTSENGSIDSVDVINGDDHRFSQEVTSYSDQPKNQLPGILGGVGPMHSLVQLVQGLKDLVWLPIEQYRKDGRIVRGFQRGAASFGTSTAMAALELTNRMVQTIQVAAETAYDMVSPGPTFIETKKIKRFPRHRLAHQPVDLREGVAKAYSVVKEGITDTAQTIYETAAREHENRGVTGAVGGVLRQIPPTVVKPFIVATEATSNVLGGMRNQIRPDVRQEESQKWRLGED
uniref:Autophagy related 2B n=1 Tax=Pavo cristatus TaxID=9049 RepID=A0A8C9FHB2_PAVCR